MYKKILILILATGFIQPAAALDLNSCRRALSKPASEAGSAGVNEKGILTLEPSENYLKTKKESKATAIEKIFAEISGPCGHGPYIVHVSTDHYGEMWKISGGKTEFLESRSYANIGLGGKPSLPGKWFASFGVRRMGGDYPNNGLNLRFGSMLYKNKYDLAVSYDYSKYSDADAPVKSLGLSGRRLMALSPHTGCNFGVKIDRTDSFGEVSADLSGIIGLNIYLPGGSFDITYNMGGEGMWGIILGYTVFINKADSKQ